MSTSIQRSPLAPATSEGGEKAGVGVSGTIESQMRPGVGVTGAKGVGKGSGEDGIEVGEAKGGGVGEAGSGIGEVAGMLVTNCREKVKGESDGRGKNGVGVEAEIAENACVWMFSFENPASPSRSQSPPVPNRRQSTPGTSRNNQKCREYFVLTPGTGGEEEEREVRKKVLIKFTLSRRLGRLSHVHVGQVFQPVTLAWKGYPTQDISRLSQNDSLLVDTL